MLPDLSPLVARSLLPHFLKAARRVEKWPCVKGWDAVTRRREPLVPPRRLQLQTDSHAKPTPLPPTARRGGRAVDGATAAHTGIHLNHRLTFCLLTGDVKVV